VPEKADRKLAVERALHLRGCFHAHGVRVHLPRRSAARPDEALQRPSMSRRDRAPDRGKDPLIHQPVAAKICSVRSEIVLEW
jgi:hypothetical protein